MLFFLTTMPDPLTPKLNTLLEQYIARMAKGDVAALEALYAQTKTAVYGFALSIVKSPHSAEDVMQDCFVRVYEAAMWYKPQGKPMAWVLTIARNFALMKLRSASNTVPYEDALENENAQDFTPISEERLVLKAALETLSDEERQIVTLHSVAGLKHREIANMLELPLSTVLNKYRRALVKLQNKVKEEN